MSGGYRAAQAAPNPHLPDPDTEGALLLMGAILRQAIRDATCQPSSFPGNLAPIKRWYLARRMRADAQRWIASEGWDYICECLDVDPDWARSKLPEPEPLAPMPDTHKQCPRCGVIEPGQQGKLCRSCASRASHAGRTYISRQAEVRRG